MNLHSKRRFVFLAALAGSFVFGLSITASTVCAQKQSPQPKGKGKIKSAVPPLRPQTDGWRPIDDFFAPEVSPFPTSPETPETAKDIWTAPAGNDGWDSPEGEPRLSQRTFEQEAPKAPALPSSPETAEELLNAIQEPAGTDQYISNPPARLSEQEAKKAANILRQRYPIESLRERLGDQATPQGTEIKLANEPFSAIFGNQRSSALQQLHSDEVNNFINRSGNGFGRMEIPRPSPYDLERRGRYATRLQSRPIGSDLRSEPTVELETRMTLADEDVVTAQNLRARYEMSENGMPTQEMAQLFHRGTANGFANPDANGYVKNVDEVAGFEAHRARFALKTMLTEEDWDQSITGGARQLENLFNRAEVEKPAAEGKPAADVDWKLNRLQLVSLLLHDEARVYVSENLPNMEELSGTDVETRGLDPFELDALRKLREGEETVTIATPNRLLMLGAMRATNNCMQCHNVEENELLGAFSYEFLRDPKLELKPRDGQP